MKIYLIDPKKKWCKANLHCHTTHSDGFYAPEQIKKLYMEQGYQIVAYSDHELIFDNSELTDENFVAITSGEYSICDFEKPANAAYCNPNEKVIWRDLKVIHLNLFAKEPHNTFHPAFCSAGLSEDQKKKYLPNVVKCDEHIRHFDQQGIQEVIDRCNNAGYLVQFNHPNWSLNVRDDYINLKGLWSLEIYNYLTEIETGAELCINIYDDMLRNGHKIMCTMGDDNHNFEGKMEGSFGGFNYIGVNKLTYEEVISAMERGYIYASSGPQIKSMYIDTDEWKIYVDCTEATDIIFVGLNRTFRHYHGENLTTADFKIFGGEVYFRIQVKDKYGNVACTHAYYLEDYGYKEENKNE